MKIAVIKTGGKQYKVSEGDVVTIEKIKGEHEVGGKVVFDEVLLVAENDNAQIGMPALSGVSVTGTIAAIGRSKKIMVVKYKPKSRYVKRKGHRQPFFKVKIDSVK